MEQITREQAYDLLKEYNKDPFHLQHALTVEAVMKWYAKEAWTWRGSAILGNLLGLVLR